MILILHPHIRLNTMLFENCSSDISFYSPIIKYYDYKIYSIFILVFPIHFHSFFLWSVYISFLYLWHWFCFKTLGFTYIISNPVVKRIKVLYQISRLTTYEAAQILIRVLVLNILMALIFYMVIVTNNILVLCLFFFLDFDVQSSKNLVSNQCLINKLNF
jgi:hypothetical protein